MSADIKELLNIEFNKLYKTFWSNYLNKDYIYKGNKKYYRTEIKKINNINKIKSAIFNKIGVIPVYIFLTSFCHIITFPGPHNNIDKILCIIYQLLDGCSTHNMDQFLNETTYYRIYAQLFIENEEKLNKWIDYMFQNFFSNVSIRILSAQLKNPQLLKNATCIIDGHHNKIIYEDIKISKKEFHSYKLKKPGLNTQFVIDNNGMTLYISDSKPCRNNNDDIMFINNVNLTKFLHYGDALCFDGLYKNTLSEVIIKYNKINLNISENNFIYPIKKQKNIDLNNDERLFNEELGSYRSRIETYFAELGNTFKRFHPKSNIRITESSTFNVQMKLCCLFLNIKKFVEIGNITETDIHRQWMNDDFDYPSDDAPVIIESTTVENKLENIRHMQNLQNELINLIIASNNNDNYEENNIIDNNNNINNDDVNMIDKDYIKDNKSFEVSYIITHEYTENKTIKYLVKWKGYRKKDNSWVNEQDFDSGEMIEKYWQSIG